MASGIGFAKDSPGRRFLITLPGAQRLHIRGPSADGIDVDSSQNVTIRKCYISTDDDDIVLKGRGRLIHAAPWRQFFNLQGQPAPTQEVNDITVRNIHGTYGAFGVLRANPGDVLKNFTFENIDVSLRNPTFRPAPVQHFVIRHVIVNGKPLVLPGEGRNQ